MNYLATLWRRYGALLVIAVVLIVFAVAVVVMAGWVHTKLQACDALGWDTLQCLALVVEEPRP